MFWVIQFQLLAKFHTLSETQRASKLETNPYPWSGKSKKNGSAKKMHRHLYVRTDKQKGGFRSGNL